MTEQGTPVVVREKTSRLTGSRIATTLVLDREFTSDELGKFYRFHVDEGPRPTDFEVDGRTVRFECDAENGEKWRRAFEASVARACGPAGPAAPRPTSGIRERSGFRKLHLG